MNRSSLIISWILQLSIAAIFIPTAYFKLTGNPESVALFSKLGMEPTGRYVIGFLEAAACGLLLNPNSAVHGAILALGIMMGAVIAHSSKIGFSDGVFGYIAIALVIVSSAIIFIRRKQIKSIARMLS